MSIEELQQYLSVGEDNKSEDDKSEDGKSEDSKSEDDKSEDDVPKISAAKQRAISNGWKPKDEFTGDDEEFVNHVEFNKRTDLHERIGSQNKAIKGMEKKLKALIDHNSKIEERTRNKTIKELESQKRDAIKHADTDGYDDADTKIKELKKEGAEAKKDVVDEKKEAPESVVNFAKRNEWFDKDKDLTDYAVFKVQKLVNSGDSLDEALEKTEKEINERFVKPEATRNKNKDRPSTTLSGNKSKNKSSRSISSLDPQTKLVWQSLKDSMSESEFLKQLGD